MGIISSSGRIVNGLNGPIQFRERASGITPAALTSLAFWTRGDLGTFASAGGSASSVDGAVGEWQDQSGNSRHAAQSTAGAKPTLRAASVGGQYAVEGDGGDILITPSFSLAAVHCFVILKIANHASVRLVLEHSANVISNNGFWIGTGSAVDGGGSWVRGASASVFVQAPSNNWWNDGNVVCAEIRAGAAGIGIYKNGSLGASSATNPGAISSQPLHLFARSGPTLGTVGAVAEVVICAAVQDSTKIAGIYAYFAARYGITFA